MLNYVPDHPAISQLRRNPDGTTTGRNDCWEACQASYLRLRALPDLPAGDVALVDAISLVARGVPDTEWNDPTTLPDAERALARYGVPYLWSPDPRALQAAQLSIILVDGAALEPRRYPAAWFDDPHRGNHFVLWMPPRDGAANWFMDPLAGAYVTYDPASVLPNCYGGFLLPDLDGLMPGVVHAARRCALKVQPDHTCIALAAIAAGEALHYLAQDNAEGEVWARVRTAAGRVGHVPLACLEPQSQAAGAAA